MGDITSTEPYYEQLNALTSSFAVDYSGVSNREVASSFGYRGYHCQVMLNDFCRWCGYVMLPKGHPLFTVHYDRLANIPVHGGLTFSNSVDGYWTLGFDCAHSGDSIDRETAQSFADNMRAKIKTSDSLKTIELLEQTLDSMVKHVSGSIIWTREMVEDECRKLVDAVCSVVATGAIAEMLSELVQSPAEYPDCLPEMGKQQLLALLLAFPGSRAETLIESLENIGFELGTLPVVLRPADGFAKWAPEIPLPMAKQLMDVCQMAITAWAFHGLGDKALKFDIQGGCSAERIWSIARNWGMDKELSALEQGVPTADVYPQRGTDSV